MICNCRTKNDAPGYEHEDFCNHFLVSRLAQEEHQLQIGERVIAKFASGYEFPGHYLGKDKFHEDAGQVRGLNGQVWCIKLKDIRLDTEPKPDLINHPPHYTSHPSGVECIQIVEHMNFNIGNAIKYLWRAGLKGEQLEDLEKASWYVQREIERISRGQT